MPDETAIPRFSLPDLPSPLDVRPALRTEIDRTPPPAAPLDDPMSKRMREVLVAATHARWQAIGAVQRRKLELVNARHPQAGGAPPAPSSGVRSRGDHSSGDNPTDDF